MIPPIFKDSELWFKLYVATLKANGIDALSVSGGYVCQMACVVDSVNYVLEFNTWQTSKKIHMTVSIKVNKHDIIYFSIAYARRWWTYIANVGRPNQLSETEKYHTEKYARRRLPHMRDEEFIKHFEHVIMMFKLAGEKSA